MANDQLTQADAANVNLGVPLMQETLGDALTFSDLDSERLSTFFCAKTNVWVTSACAITPPSPAASVYPVFDPTSNSWISSGAYGSGTPATYPFFCRSSNEWVGAGTCP